MHSEIREIIARTVELPGGIAGVSDPADLYEAGMTSFGSVQLMLALEEACLKQSCSAMELLPVAHPLDMM